MDMACEEVVAGPMTATAIGFEGFEKRLEIEFLASSFFTETDEGRGLRALTRAQLDEILNSAECKIVSVLCNEHFDSYLLSESSLFVYPMKIILKTCGTTKLLLSIPLILSNATSLSLSVKNVKYSRGTFIHPGAQSFPHRSFSEEVSYLDKYFGALGFGSMAYVMGNSATSHNWHIYSAYAAEGASHPVYTLEMCMTHLDRERASLFYKGHCNSAAEMTHKSGISKILPHAKICDFEFDPCGYSMNSIEGPALSTIHVTPEDGFSYASFEAMGYDPKDCDLETLVERVLSCFRPMIFSIAVHVNVNVNAGACQSTWTKPVCPQGYTCEMIAQQELTKKGSVLIYCTYRIANAQSKLATSLVK